ncbi:hemolysin family protein [Pseudoroseomonas globiformis]|uniref:Polyamine export protein n=1 Tax=Teichococcus globiformis TaxID=2307229 RepID=A0ABV7FX21_9PROT
MDILFGLGLILLLVAGSILISLSEIAFAAARETRLSVMAQGGESRAARFLALRRDPAGVVTALQITVNAVGILAGVVGEGALTPGLARLLVDLGVGPWSESIASVSSFVLVTGLFVLFSDLVPKRVAMMQPERVAVAVGWFPAFALKVLRPLVWVFSGLADALMRLLGLPTSASAETVTAEELRATLAASAESGTLDAGEHRLIENVLALRERTVTSAMTPRDEIIFLDLRETPEEWREKVRRDPYSRYPVCDGGLDNVVGYTRAEDVLAEVLQAGPGALKPDALKPGTQEPARMRRDAPSVPETLDLWEVLAQFEAQGAGFALVVSEYAMVVGLVTYKDVLAALVGGLADPFEERAIVRRDSDSWLVDGIATLSDVALALGTEALPTDGPFRTAGGFVMHRLRRVPRKADRVEAAGFVFEVVDVEGFRVNQLLVTRKTPPVPPPSMEALPG